MFRLRKWHLDLVTPAGDVAVVEVAEASLMGVRTRYSAALVVPVGKAAVESVSRAPGGWPRVRGGEVVLSVPSLGMTGLWSAEDAVGEPIVETLVSKEESRLRWVCHLPRAVADLQLSDGRTVSGTGYVDELEMTAAPWRAPFAELRRGWFHGEGGASVVWTECRGGEGTAHAAGHGTGHGTATVWAGGRRIGGAKVTDDEVTWEGGRLAVPGDRLATFRERRVNERLGAGARLIGGIMPGDFSRAVVTEGLTRASLEAGNGAIGGHAMIEVARWR